MLGRILAVIIVILIVLTYVEPFTEPELPNVKVLNPTGTTTLLIIAGMHGNEPAGTVGLNAWLDRISVVKLVQRQLRIVAIPAANSWGLENNTRYLRNFWYRDLNRNFVESGNEPVSQFIVRLIQKYRPTLVIDIHEGWGFHKIEPASIGSTVTSSSHKMSRNMAETMVKDINGTITDPAKKFTHRDNIACDIGTTLGCWCDKSSIPYILIEVTGQKDRQPMNVRVEQVVRLLNTVIA